MRFGAGMRFTTTNVSNKPPSRAASKKARRPKVQRPESVNRLMREDRTAQYRGKGGVSLSRTTGKRASRIIFSEKTDSKPEIKSKKTSVFTEASMPSTNYMKDYNASGTYKPSISSYLDNKITKPAVGSGSLSSGIFGATSSTSNFPKKIAVKRDSEESTRDETKLTKSSYFSKSEKTSKSFES